MKHSRFGLPWWVYLLGSLLLAFALHRFELWSGLFVLTPLSATLVMLLMTHVTIACVTIYLHRHQAHRALDLHPVVSHPMRLWLWLTTGMITKVWAAIHRKHHAKCETIDDPHSPKVYGLTRVLFGGAGLYVTESADSTTVEKYGKGTPDDAIERALYTPYSRYGVALMYLIDLVLFGPLYGVLFIWVLQMVWIPFFAAGVINGVGHYVGYRNWPSLNKKTGFEDWSTNISPIGIVIGGEELHNNHHHFPYSAKLSTKWWEFDIGWLYIRIMETFGLARVKYIYDKPVG